LKRLTILFILSLFILSFAQQTNNLNDFPFYVDAATFPDMNNERSYTELYFGLFGEALNYIRTTQGENMARFVITTEVFNSADSLIDKRRWVRDVNKRDLLKGATPLFHIGYLVLKPGEYKIKSTLLDVVSENEKVIKQVVEVPSFFETDNVNMSDIELAYKINKATENNPFTKNGLMIIPNPSRIFVVGKNLLNVYFEIMNLKFDENNPSSVSIDYEISDNMGNIIKTYNQEIEKPGKSAIVYRTFNIATLDAGIYSMNIKIVDNANGKSCNVAREFEVFIEPQQRQRPAEASGVVSLNEEQAEMYKHLLDAIASEEELDMYETLSSQQKVVFIENFWRKRDPTPDTPDNEYRQEILRRWNYVKKFSRSKVPGYRTQFGQVYLELGEPDHIERNMNPNYRPYQIWYFYDERIEIVFADLRGTDVYTVISEKRPDGKGIYNPNWMDRVQIDKAGFAR